MKIVKIRNDVIFYVSLTVFASSGFILWWGYNYIMPSLNAFWLALALALIIIVSPWGSQRLPGNNDKPTFPPLHWLLNIFAIQLSLTAAFLGICELCGQVLPIGTSLHPHLFSTNLQLFLTHYGLFPWSLYAICAVGFGVVAYRSKENGYFNKLLFPLFKSQEQQPLGLTFNGHTKLFSISGFSITLALLCVLLAALICSAFQPFTTGFTPGTVMLTIVLIFFAYTHYFRKYLTKSLTPPIPIPLANLKIAIVFVLLLIALNLVLSPLNKQTQLSTPKFITTLQQSNWMQFWHIFSASWWLVWTPIMGIFIARISRGYTVRQMLFASLLLPAITACVLSIWPPHSSWYSPHPILGTVIAWVGFIGIIFMFMQHKMLPMFILSYLPNQDRYKHRDHQDFFRKVYRLATASLYLFLPAGVSLLFIFMYVLAFPLYFYMLAYLIALPLLLIKTKTAQQG